MKRELLHKIKSIEKDIGLELIYVRNLPKDATYEQIHEALKADQHLLEQTFQDMLKSVDTLTNEYYLKTLEK